MERFLPGRKDIPAFRFPLWMRGRFSDVATIAIFYIIHHFFCVDNQTFELYFSMKMAKGFTGIHAGA